VETLGAKYKYRARICKRLGSLGIDSASLCSLAGRYYYPLCRTGQAIYASEIDSLELTPGLLKYLHIRALVTDMSG
jgi:hypothetical protein